MSEILKVCKYPRELVKRRSPSENVVFSANRLIDDIKKKTNPVTVEPIYLNFAVVGKLLLIS